MKIHEREKWEVIDHVSERLMEASGYVVVRTNSAGVFAGILKSRNGQEVVLLNARRIWYWDGADSLEQLVMEGTSKPQNCKFSCEVNRMELLEVIEILDVTLKAMNSIRSVPVWNPKD